MSPTAASSTVYGPVQAGEAAFGPSMMQGPTMGIADSGVEEEPGMSTAVEIALILTVLSVLPALLITVTCFTRIVIVLSFVRRAMSINELPPNPVLIGLALFLTAFVMGPVVSKIYDEAWVPYQAEELTMSEASDAAWDTLSGFLLANTRQSEIDLFNDIAGGTAWAAEPAVEGDGTTAAEASEEPALTEAPGGTWLRVLADRQAGRTREAIARLDQGPLADTALSQITAAWLALEGFHREEAVTRAQRAVADHPEHPELALHAATITALAVLQPWGAEVPGTDGPAAEARRADARRQALEWIAQPLGPSPRVAATELLLEDTPEGVVASAERSELPPSTDPVVRLATAVAAWHRGEASVGHERLRSLVRDEPTSAVTRSLLARWNLELGHDSEAIRLLAPLARRHGDHELVQAWFAEAQAAHTPEERHERQVDRAFHRP